MPAQHKVGFFRVAHLQNEVGTKELFRGTNFLTKNAPRFSPNIFKSVFLWVRNILQIPANFPSKCPSPKSKQITDELLQERREKDLLSVGL